MDTDANEQVIYEGRPSWRSILGFYILGLLMVGWLKRISTRYSITDRRLRIQRGIVSRNVEEARIERVQNVNVRQSVFERILQVGTIDFDTASNRADDTFQFRGIAQPEKIVRLVDQAHEANAARHRAKG